MGVVVYVIAFLSGELFRFLILGRGKYMGKGFSFQAFLHSLIMGTANIFYVLAFALVSSGYTKAKGGTGWYVSFLILYPAILIGIGVFQRWKAKKRREELEKMAEEARRTGQTIFRD